MVLVVAALFAGASALMFTQIRQELTPSEDRSVALLSIAAPQGVSLDFTSTQLRTIEALVEPLRQSGEIENVFAIAGRNGANNGFMVLTLAPWEKRTRSQQEIAEEINRKVANVPGVRAFAIQPEQPGHSRCGLGLAGGVARR